MTDFMQTSGERTDDSTRLCLFVVYAAVGFSVRPTRFAVGDKVRSIEIGRLDADSDIPRLADASKGGEERLRLSLPVRAVSTHHAELRRDEEGDWTLADLGSKHGTRACAIGVKGCALGVFKDAPRPVGLGDWFSVGPVLLLLDEVQWPPDLQGEDGARASNPHLRTLLPSLERSVNRLSQSALPIRALLILGESGTGKEGLARAYHDAGPRRDGPWEVLNCSTIKPDFAVSDLFGHLRGAFHGATADHAGVLLSAHGGTAFLDEVATLDPRVQPQLLRAIQECSFRRMMASREETSDFHLVCATNEDLATLVSQNRFRDDLHKRLNEEVIRLPRLPDRRMDTGLLFENLLGKIGAEIGRSHLRLSMEAALVFIMHAGHGGNIRGLENALIRAARRADEKADVGNRSFIELSDIAHDDWIAAHAVRPALGHPKNGEELRAELVRHNWNVSATMRAYGVKSQKTIRNWMKKHSVNRPTED